ncbi:MAG: hypothetical protein E7623_08040, partial [Ruminococcaceae bacterium]|nr:hypothetical protein [Oscillospiraceae bacterium]
CMTVKKGLTLESQDTDMKLHLKPDATLFDIYDAANKTIDNAVAEGDTNEMDSVSRALVKLPVFLLRGFVNLMSAMDFLGIMPKAIEEASPFHCGLYVTNLGSLGIAPVYHHLFNFGTCPLFLAFGAKRREYKVCEDGSVKTMKYIDYTCTTDERIVDGHYYASAFKIFESYMKHPEKLELPPETVTEDIE